MIKVADTFSFEPPAGWDESRRKASLVYKRSERELVVSVWPAESGKRPDKLAESIEYLMKSALAAVGEDLKNPNLKIAVPLTRVEEAGTEFWVQSLATRDATLLFNSAVVRGSAGVMVVTLEIPNTESSFPTFIDFLRTVRPLPQ